MSKSKQWKQIERDWANVYLPRRDEDVVEAFLLVLEPRAIPNSK